MCDAETFLHTRDLALWRGPLLDGLDSEQGADAADLLYAALHSAADAALAHDPREAARAGRILLQADPYDRAALALTLRALRASGNRKGALATYQSAAARFAEVGETLPPAWQDFLNQCPAG
nr:BTAD domain-containing putative transcriptional regulator [Deinococcus betulae]